MNKWICFVLIGIIVILDQLSKYCILQHLIPYYPLKLIPMLNFTLAFNSGSAFSFLSDAGEWHRYFFIIFSSLVSLMLIIWMIRTPSTERLKLVGLSLIIGGALGNLIDRVLLGHVVDFIDVYYATHHWPAFNIADSSICIGAVILFFCLS